MYGTKSIIFPFEGSLFIVVKYTLLKKKSQAKYGYSRKKEEIHGVKKDKAFLVHGSDVAVCKVSN